jgi:outer membrane protein TolC
VAVDRGVPARRAAVSWGVFTVAAFMASPAFPGPETPPAMPAPPPAATTGFSAPPASPSAPVLGLDEAIDLALRQNRDLRQAGLEVEKAAEELAATRSNALPALDLSVMAGRRLGDLRFRFPEGAFGDFPGVGPIPAADTDVVSEAGTHTLVLGQISQPLTQLRRVSLASRARALDLEVRREQLRGRRQTVVEEVRRLYYDLLMTGSALRATEEGILFLRELERVVGDLVGQHAALRAEGLEVQARRAAEEYEAIVLRNALTTVKERLNERLGRDIDTPFEPDPIPDTLPEEADLAGARARALEARADLKEARLRREQSEIDRRLKRWDYVPEVSLSFSYVSAFDVEVLPRDYRTVGLLLTWEPYDWGRRRHALRQAEHGSAQAESALRQAESLAAIDVGARLRELQEGRVLLEARRIAREAARARAQVTLDRYEQKAALLKDVLEDQETLAAAQRNYEQALAQAWQSRAALERALGLE